MEFKEKLQQLRNMNNMTQQQLADKLYVSRTAISKWESGRGYPSIDSLKAVAKLFDLSVDKLLDSNELVQLAQDNIKERSQNLCNMFMGITDCIVAVLFFLPLLGQYGESKITSVNLINFTSRAKYLAVVYNVFVVATVVLGVVIIALQNVNAPIWHKYKNYISICLSIASTVLFIASRQPYVAVFMFCLLIVKTVIVVKER